MALLSGGSGGLLSGSNQGGVGGGQSAMNPNTKQRGKAKPLTTFAGMQQEGMARPSPQGVQPAACSR